MCQGRPVEEVEGVQAVLPVLPWTAAALAVVLLVGLQVAPPSGGVERTARSGASPAGSRLGAVLLGAVLLALAAGARLGPATELENPVSALVVGLAWPALLVLPALLSPLLPRPAGGPADVRPTLPLALLVVGVLVAVPERSRPDVLGALLLGYGVLLLAAGVAGGREAAGRADVLGLLARWSSLGGRLPRWAPPRGAAAVLVLVLGGAWAERFSRTTAWTEQTPDRAALVVLLAGAVALAAVCAVPLRRAGAAAVLVPLAAGAVLAGGFRRALVAVQLLLPGPGVLADPLGVPGGQGLALGAATVGGCAAAAVLARRSGPGADRLAGLGGVLLASGVTCWVVLQP